MREFLLENGALTATALSLVFPILIITIWFRRSTRRRRDAREVPTPIEGTDAERESAEAALRGSNQELRERLLETHGLYDRYSTLHGFTDSYMGDLTKRLTDAGIASEILFQETMPVGAVGMIERQGMYELYILRDDLDRAGPILKAWEQRRP